MDSKELALELLKKGEKRYSVWDVIVSMKGRIFLCLYCVFLVWYQWHSRGFYSDLFFGGIAGLCLGILTEQFSSLYREQKSRYLLSEFIDWRKVERRASQGKPPTVRWDQFNEPVYTELNTSQILKNYLDALLDLNDVCDAHDLVVYEHSYNLEAFGSWFVTIGKPHHRIRFSWDGKESSLSATESDFSSANSNPSWQPTLLSVSGTKVSEEDVFGLIRDELQCRYAT